MENNIYNEKLDDLYKKFDTNNSGLSIEEAKKRLERDGENKLTQEKKKSNIGLFIKQFNDFLIILLIFASIFSFFVSYIGNESYTDSIIIITIVFINAILSFIQEKKADVAINELNKMFITSTYVIRNNQKIKIDVRDLVVGDIVELEAGDYIAGDARIIESYSLLVNEAILTGESVGVGKNNLDINEPKELYERSNMVYAGCTVTNGRAKVLVTAVGMNTELGHIAKSLTNKKSELTPLQKKVNQFSKILTYIVLTVIVIMMVLGFIQKQDFLDVLMLSISLAVAAIPEGLSSIITIILSIGMISMAKKNVIIRKMSSVETLGSTDIICSDKTGTITENKMIVKSLFVNDKIYNELSPIENFNMLNLAARCCHNVFKNDNNYVGDETEVAIYKYLEKLNNNFNYKRIGEIPFDSNRKMMSTINDIDNKQFIFTKGSLDSIIKKSKYYLIDNKIINLTESIKQKILEYETLESKKSLRLIAFAYKEGTNNPENDMIFLGLIGMMDPPRSNVVNAIETCTKAGLKPIMITGDSLKTAIAIGKEVNIIQDETKAIEGKYIDKMTDDELLTNVLNYQVYARITPNTKLRIVETLESLGYVVAMTGDGVNDAPAIQKANIGIAMGITGTEVVKKVADCILVDDSFSTIVDGVKEGRRINANIKKVIAYLFAGNIVEVILVFISMLLNMEMFTTIQLLWINLITDSIPAIMLAFEDIESNIMENNKENRSSTSFFTPFLVARIVFGAVTRAMIIMLLFLHFAKINDIYYAGSLIFIYLIIHELLYALSCRDLKKSIINKKIFANKYLSISLGILIVIQIIVLSTSFKSSFIVTGINNIDIIKILIICLITFILGELIKPIFNKLFKDYKEEK